jgi:MinD superfamily P-loop ATPase
MPAMREILIISGKGGTGKTTLTAAFADLAKNHVICDLDVDAPDMHLLLRPENEMVTQFVSGHEAVVRADTCEHCGTCTAVCQFDAIQGDNPPVVNPLKCEGCKLCVALCPAEAIEFTPNHCGDWYRSSTRFGPMVHAQLLPAEENSGRLVALLRQQSRAIAEDRGLDLILSDGPPGIGCPVIAALSGIDLAVIVTEPTVSGRHDLERVLELCHHFNIPAGVVINKCDLNLEQTHQIKAFCREHQLTLLGKLPHDTSFTQAMIKGLTITEFAPNGIGRAIRSIWHNIIQQAASAPVLETVAGG